MAPRRGTGMLDSFIAFVNGPYAIWTMAAIYFSFVGGERVYAAFFRRGEYDNREALCSVALNLMNSLIWMGVGILLPIALYWLVYENARLFTVDHVLIAIVIAFVVHELSYYTEHRISHRVGLFWAFHTIHHSANQFNHTVAARGFVLDGYLQSIFALVAALLGVSPLIYFAVSFTNKIYGIWNHASYVGHLGVLERYLATPRNHMAHHGTEGKYIDRNYSQVLIIWDRLFGTFAPYEEKPRVGLIEPVHDVNPLTAQFVGIAQLKAKIDSAERWQDKLGYLWRPPEWSHKTQSPAPHSVPAE